MVKEGVSHLSLSSFCRRIIINSSIFRNIKPSKETCALLKSSNIFNVIFAYKANQLWPFLFFSLAFLQIYFHYLARMDILPLPISSTETSSSYLTYTNHWPLLKNRIISIMITQYACKFVLKYLLLFLNFQFIDHVFIWTGENAVLVVKRHQLKSAV